jgi:hypothetical protein
MAEILSYDPSSDPEVIASIESDQAESLAIGEALINQANQQLAGKYKNAQELEKAYIELEKRLGSNTPEEQEEPAEEYDEEGSQDSDFTFEDLMRAAGDEYQETGQLSEEMLEAFSEMSSRDLVQAYFEMQANETQAPAGRELEANEIAAIQNSVGGEAQYNRMTEWAAENFSPDEVEAFDSLVESGNTAAIKLALQALQYRYTDAMGYEGNMLQGKAAAPADAFRSQAEVVRAMSDPRYDRDPAYRNEIMEKLARSDLKF